MPPLRCQAKVLHGFQDAAQVANRIYERGTLVNLLLPPGLANEFIPASAFGALGDVVRRGGRVRLITTGPISDACLEACHEAGILHRWVPERRETAAVASERELLLFPADQDAEPGFPESVVHVEDVVMAMRHLRAFNRTWEEGLVQAVRETAMGLETEKSP